MCTCSKERARGEPRKFYSPTKRTITEYKCDRNGRRVHPGYGPPYHPFLILSSKTYNEGSEEVLGLVLTSQKRYGYESFVFTLDDDAIVGNKMQQGDREEPNPLVGSLVLCDRPCRLYKEDIKDSDTVFLTPEAYEQILKKTHDFMRIG